MIIACFLPEVGKCCWLSRIRFGLRSSRSRFELWPSKRRESPYFESRGRGSLLDGLPVPRNAQHTETMVATKIGLLHGTSSVPGVRGEQRFDGNKVQAPECLLADLSGPRT